MQNVIHLEETKDHKLSESGTGRGYCFPPSDQLGGFRAESGESCQEPRESLVCSGRGSRRYPAPLAPPRLTRPGGSVCGPDARELRARVPAAPHLPAPRCCLPPRRARSRPHSRFLFTGRAAGRRRFLPGASRRPAAPPAECAGRPAARREGAHSETRGCRAGAAGATALLRPAAETSPPLSSPRTPASVRATARRLAPATPSAQSSGHTGGSRREAQTLQCLPLLS